MPKMDIVGHGKLCAQLLSDIAHDNVSHAYLFAGEPHLGKFTVAKWFAFRLIMEGRDPSSQEKITDEIDRLIHPDFLTLDRLWIEGVNEDWGVISKFSNIPQQNRAKTPAAKTDVISVDDVRVLLDRLTATGSSKYLCCLIRSIDRMQMASANAFLKILEEPPPRVVFILTTSNQNVLLPTIVSRTRILNFFPLKPEDLQSLTAGQDDEDAAFAVHLSRGAPGSLIELLKNPDALRLSKQMHTQAKHFWQAGSLLERLQWIMPFSEKRQDVRGLLRHLGDALKELHDPVSKVKYAKAYSELAEALQTNAHRGLLLERFTLAVEERAC
ncbi:hypothetical protein A3A67_03330 [Candidatus Peribacteria bacterium RIFCSPLOWO2_01_FULL_51_18]|nr:MAG: hypothetical protein A3A67_03330 [Candidatus Peribacteria bacterium RIFCSPLOWO2_01_FULL_51_18]OGJ68305.1 MAG: hypothetical protein A3J34_04055 [Candidatus Peribacteria bacterium RIFCSPLOWO2_02_FULL_51_10]